MMTSMRTPSELVEEFRSNGLKVTPQRRLLFELLHDNPQHPTADALFTQASAEMPGISLRTVYQTLNDLASMGEIRPVSFDSGPVHFDANVADHHHAICDVCGAIIDVYVEGTDELAIEGAEDFRSTALSIVFHGSCAACAGT